MKIPTPPTAARGRIAPRVLPRTVTAILVAGFIPVGAFAQTAFTWQQIKDKFEAANPTLKAAQLNTDESRAAEITAYLHPNPDFILSTDVTQISRFIGGWRPFACTQVLTVITDPHYPQNQSARRR